ncbi:MAG: response regulator transcription factor [Thermomicrobiales bacterium]
MRASGQLGPATRVLGALESVGDRFEIALTRAQVEGLRGYSIALNRSLGETQYRQQISGGESMSLREVLDFVLGWNPPPTNQSEPPASAPRVAELLTRREAEVVCLLGFTDREIAEWLFVGVRTVTTHVSHILGKLDVSTRSAAIAIAVRYGWCAPISS